MALLRLNRIRVGALLTEGQGRALDQKFTPGWQVPKRDDQ